MTQICNSCKNEKPLTEFHRRRAGYQRICKSCRAGKAREVKKEKRAKNAPALSPDHIASMGERISALDSNIKNACRKYAGGDEMRADDLYQNACISLLSCESWQSDNYLLSRVRFSSLHDLDKTLTYNHYMGEITPDDKVFINAAPRSVEDEIIRRDQLAEIEKAISGLSPENQKIVYMLFEGLSQSDAARDCQLTRQAINYRMRTIKESLLSALGGAIPEFESVDSRPVFMPGSMPAWESA